MNLSFEKTIKNYVPISWKFFWFLFFIRVSSFEAEVKAWHWKALYPSLNSKLELARVQRVDMQRQLLYFGEFSGWAVSPGQQVMI